jgi:hypothetical protein
MKKFLTIGFFSCLIALFPFLLAGCRSPFVSATITNHSGSPISLIEVDYPSASFGIGSLAPEATFPYRFKIQGSGSLKIQFTDATGKTHAASGPELVEGEQGSLSITIGPKNEISWVPHLSKIR